jgi:hypothetical protein
MTGGQISPEPAFCESKAETGKYFIKYLQLPLAFIPSIIP